jgi:hypothetical protein
VTAATPRHFALGLVATAALPARAAAGACARAWRLDVAAPVREPATALYEALARRGVLVEAALIDALAEQRVVERVADEVLRSDALDRWVTAVLEDEEVERLVARVLESHLVAAAVQRLAESDDVIHVVGTVARSPEVRDALQAQGTGLANELAEETRDRTARVDDALESSVRRLLRRPRRREATISIASDEP